MSAIFTSILMLWAEVEDFPAPELLEVLAIIP